MRRMAVVLLVAAFVVAGCGGGGDKKTSSTSPTTIAGASGGAAAGVFTSAKCAAAARAMANAAAAVPQAITGGSKAVEQAVAQLKAYADAAPKDIRADLNTIVEGYTTYAKVFADAHYDPSSGQAPPSDLLQKLQTETAKLNTAEFRDAGQRVSTWFQEQCGH